ncbi:restriction endonuclease subunit S [Lactiplantibacillus argentoratensis]
MKNENLVPKVRFKGFSDPWEQRKLKWFLRVSKLKNIDGIFDKNSVLSVSGEFGVVNQIAFQGRSFAGKSILNYGILDHNDVVYTKSPLKSNPYGIIKTNLGKAGVVSTLYAVYAPLKTVYSPILGYYFNLDTRVNNYLRPLVNKGAKNDMKVRDEAVLEGKVCIPDSIETQKRICNLFSLIDNLIAANEDKLEQLKTLKKLMMQKIFSQKWRFKGFTDPWEQRKWADLIDISTDMVDPRDVEFSELPHVGPGNIEAFSGQLLDNVNTVEKDHLISGKFHFYKGNIIYGKINPQLAKYIWADFEGLSSADTYVLTTKSANILNQGFIFYLLQTRNFYKYSVSVSMRTGMPKINRSELDAYSFLCPQSPEQIKIVQTIKILDDLIAANEDKLNQLKKLKKYLMQNMFV